MKVCSVGGVGSVGRRRGVVVCDLIAQRFAYITKEERKGGPRLVVFVSSQ